MTTLGPDDRYQIEAHLGRELTAEELAKAPTLDELTREQLDVVARLEGRGILAIAYTRAVVPSAEWSDAREFVIDIQDFLARKYPPAHLKMEHLYGRALGRRLTDEERRVVSTIADLTRTQAAVVRQLASGERAHGLLYLADVVKSAATHEREAFIDSLLRDVLNQDDRYHIEERLGRALSDEDLAEATTFDDLSREQLGIVVRLERSGLLASAYLRAVVPSADFSSVRNLVFTIKDFIAERYRPAPLAAEHLYESELGRPLTDQERRVVDLIPDLKEAHRVVARQLASRDPGLVRRYLREVLRSAPGFEIEVLVDHLRRESDP